MGGCCEWGVVVSGGFCCESFCQGGGSAVFFEGRRNAVIVREVIGTDEGGIGG